MTAKKKPEAEGEVSERTPTPEPGKNTEAENDAGMEEAASTEEKEEEKPPPEHRYPRAEHLELAEGMYGEPSHIIAGAMAMIDPKQKRKTFTKSEIVENISSFREQEISAKE